jgi:hypothetical protein
MTGGYRAAVAGRRAATAAVVARPAVSGAAALAVVGVTVAAAAGWLTPTVAAPARTTVDHVIVVGAPGLHWDDVDAKTTPALWRLAGRGSIGALSVRATASVTCPTDGWVTLGAGGRGRGAPHPDAGGCPAGFPLAAPVPGTAGDARFLNQSAIVDDNAKLPFGARPGALADGLRCVGALGRDGAVAGAHPSGRIDRYAPTLPANPRPFLSACPATVIGLDALGLDAAGLPEAGEDAPGEGAGNSSSVAAVSGAARRAALRQLDSAVAAVDSARPSSSLLLVVGLSDTAPPPRLHVAIADGPGFEQRWLTSASTQREPFVQLTDIASSAYAALGISAPRVLTGQPVHTGDARSADLRSAVDELVDADVAASAQRPLVQPFFTALVVLNLAVLALATLLFRWRARRAEAVARRPVPFGFSPRRMVQIYALWVAALLPASFLANGAPWWRLPAAGLVHVATVLALATAITALARAGRWGRTPLGPPACVALLSAVVLGLDVLLGSPLQLNSLAGYSPLVAGRFIGFGNLAFAVFAAGTLLGAAYLAQGLRGARRTLLLAVISVLAVMVVGGPGADVGGIIALAPACTVLVLRASGVRMSAAVMVGSAVIGFASVTLFALLDYSRPPGSRTHLGRFVAQLNEGTAGVVIRRKAEANLSLLIDSQLTLLVLAVLVFVPLVLLHATGGLRRVVGLFVCVRAGLIASVVVAAIGFAVNDSGIAVPAFVAALAVPLAVVTTVRVTASARRGVSTGPPRSPADGPVEDTVGQGEATAAEGAASPAVDTATTPVTDKAAAPAADKAAAPAVDSAAAPAG